MATIPCAEETPAGRRRARPDDRLRSVSKHTHFQRKRSNEFQTASNSTRWLALCFALVFAVWPAPAHAITDSEVQQAVAREIKKALPAARAGVAVAVRIDGRTLFFNFGRSDRAKNRPVTSDSLFNLASVSKVFDAALLSLVVKRGEMSLDDPVDKYISELAGAAIGQLTLGQLATFTSGFSLPQDHPPWPPVQYTWSTFIDRARDWKSGPDHARGQQYLYSHAGYLLLHVALERRFGAPYAVLLERELLRPLDLAATTLPARGENFVGIFPPALKRQTVQGYSGKGEPIGKPGNVQGYYHWPGTEQMFSSARDMAQFLAAQLGELPLDGALQDAIALSQRPVTSIHPQVMQAQAWEVHQREETIIGKNGGLNNTSSYIAIVPGQQLGIVILVNRGDLNTWDFGYPILQRLMRDKARR